MHSLPQEQKAVTDLVMFMLVDGWMSSTNKWPYMKFALKNTQSLHDDKTTAILSYLCNEFWIDNINYVKKLT